MEVFNWYAFMSYNVAFVKDQLARVTTLKGLMLWIYNRTIIIINHRMIMNG